MDTLPHDACRLQAEHIAAACRVVALDLESHPGQQDQIFAIGAVRSDDAQEFLSAYAPARAASVTAALNAFCSGAQHLLGHNLKRHDLPLLQAQLPQFASLGWPALDSLEISALAFPNNPYHRLIKGYKLLSDARNHPEQDARLSLQILHEAIAAWLHVQAQAPWWLALLHALLRGDPGMRALLAQIRGLDAPDLEHAAQLIRTRFTGHGCATALQALSAEIPTAPEPQAHWALALALGWLRVAGGNSVLPHWVLHEFPAARTWVARLRDTHCQQPDCHYCRTQHDPDVLLRTLFRKPGFRPYPSTDDGGSLQRAIVCAGLARENLLAVLPTGGGKSICYQLPALAHYRRTGRLTVVISPLQSLMRDQVDNLLNADVQCAATVNGMLTPLERRDVLDRIRLGDIGIVLVSPEQFRSRTFLEAIRMRDIATWVFDEAHCLSKWGHDFRPDYLYVSRVIREQFAAQAPIACFTATARPDVIDDLREHFHAQLHIHLRPFLGGHERHNLSYTVLPASAGDKPQRILALLRDGLRDGDAAIIFCATRKHAAAIAQMVSQQGIACGCYHGGLSSDMRQATQRRFLQGELAVIAATNAFGMGVDKPNVRLVIHADIPGALENYLQEAGRAGRDGAPAQCVLLFDPQDVETQFRLASATQLTPRDFTGLLRALRTQAKKIGTDEIVLSAQELLAQTSGINIEAEAPDAATKVSTALSWLERHAFLRRNENATRVFPTSLRVSSLQEAKARIAQADLSAATTQQFIAVATALFRSDTPEGLSTDEFMLEAGIAPEACFRIMYQLAKLGVLVNDLGLTVRVVRGVKGASASRLAQLIAVEQALVTLMAEQAPHGDPATGQQLLNLRAVCAALRDRLPAGEVSAPVDPSQVRACLRAMADGFGAGNDKRSMITLHTLGEDTLRVTARRPWPQIQRICALRRHVARVTLQRLLAEVPAGVKGACLVECKAQALIDALNADLVLNTQLREPDIALEHALLYLHQTRVLELDKGRSVFRAAMTIQMAPDTARRFNHAAFAPLEAFYHERTVQTHVMHEYARLGLTHTERASALVQAYFSQPQKAFLRTFFRGRTEWLERRTTEDAYRRIVSALDHPIQQALVTQPRVGNHLVLAGPGAGKTRVIVHRIAYLLRVLRVAPSRIIALTYNRSAAVQLHRRLIALAGDDARGVRVMTYHAMALRLTGTSLAGAERAARHIDFPQMLQDAIDLLEGRSTTQLDSDEVRDQLLQGYEYIFVDEYQDIDAQQYALVSALAGRRRSDVESRLSIMAVGDDDQNIYSFKGANIEFIRRFQSDYDGELSYLVENFRATQHIIDAANHVIARDPARMKVAHPVRINRQRQAEPAGGRWASVDAESRGAVRVIHSPADANRQAQIVLAEILRLRRLDPTGRLSDIAVLCRTHAPLETMRARCELEALACEIIGPEAARGQIALLRTREGHALVQALQRRQLRMLRVQALPRALAAQARRHRHNAIWQDLAALAAELPATLAARHAPAADLLELLYEAASELRRDGSADAIKLLTAHGAKGLEFDHVIVMDCADWRWERADERRLLYVAMTRARQSLCLMRAEHEDHPYLHGLEGRPGVHTVLPATRPVHHPALQRRYLMLGPASIDIGFAGRHAPHHPIHAALAGLHAGDTITLRHDRLHTHSGELIGRLASNVDAAALQNGVVSVVAMMVRTRTQTPARYQARLQCESWEFPLIEVAFMPAEPV